MNMNKFSSWNVFDNRFLGRAAEKFLVIIRKPLSALHFLEEKDVTTN